MLIEEFKCDARPEDLFGALCDRPHAFLLDSALDANGLGKFTFIGFDPFLVFRSQGNRITLTRPGHSETREGDPLEELRRVLQTHRAPSAPAPLPFAGGAVGYFTYEFGLRFERIAGRPGGASDEPEAEFGLYDSLIAFAADTGKAYLVANPVDQALASSLLQTLARTVRDALDRIASPRPESAPAAPAEPRANFTKAEYLAAITRIKDYIAAGDVYQVNLSQRFTAPNPHHPYALYRRLRRHSPAPFASYLNFGARQVVSSSPERLLRLQDGRVETRPIKGTRPRGRTPAEDAALRHELLTSAKDRAELLMIVDLERNDLGRVCQFGSIAVEELYCLEAHPTVFHLVSQISGRLAAGRDAFDCLRAAFPGGSITGAPKIRAMQIIAELERDRRDIYTGAVGYLGFDGNCDLNIAIRTIQCRQGQASFHVGGGIVADSDPEAEYQETLDKGRAMHAALAGP
ncbi:MAG: aminodeoxychorismate synthase component I [Opitutales bacterium]